MSTDPQLGHAAFHSYGHAEGITPKHLREAGNLPALPNELDRLRLENAQLRAELSGLRAKAATPTPDAGEDGELLDWMTSRGAYVSWSRDHEVCNVWVPSNDEGEGYVPAEGYPQKCYLTSREAIRAAKKAIKSP